MGKISVVSVAVGSISACFFLIQSAPSAWGGSRSGLLPVSTPTADSLSSASSILATTSSFLSSDSSEWKFPGGFEDAQTVEAVAAIPDLETLPLKIGEWHHPLSEAEVPASTLYHYQMDDQEVATVYLKDLPVISFVEHPDLDPPLLRASRLVSQLNLLSQTAQDFEVSLEVKDMTQDPTEPQGQYVILLDGQLLPIDDGVLLTGEKNASTVALMATNRLRRLLLQSPPIKTPPPLPQPVQPDSPEPIMVGLAPEPDPTLVDQGYASWYGHGPHAHELIAAHRELPFGTEVRVTNLENGKIAVVTIEDRGPFLKGRVIDLSRAAAQAIDMIHAGVVKVQIEVVTPQGL